MEKLANKKSLLLKKVRKGLHGHMSSTVLPVLVGFTSALFLPVYPLQKEESMRKIRELGSLPADAFDKYHGLALSQVIFLLVC